MVVLLSFVMPVVGELLAGVVAGSGFLRTDEVSTRIKAPCSLPPSICARWLQGRHGAVLCMPWHSADPGGGIPVLSGMAFVSSAQGVPADTSVFPGLPWCCSSSPSLEDAPCTTPVRRIAQAKFRPFKLRNAKSLATGSTLTRDVFALRSMATPSPPMVDLAWIGGWQRSGEEAAELHALASGAILRWGLHACGTHQRLQILRMWVRPCSIRVCLKLYSSVCMA